jgi:hypothetical protein
VNQAKNRISGLENNVDVVRKTPHTTHKGGSREVSHVQKFNKWAGWLREDGAAASLGGSGLK